MVGARQQRYERHQSWTERTSRNPLRELCSCDLAAAWALHLVQHVLVDIYLDMGDLCDLMSQGVAARLLRQVTVALTAHPGETLMTTCYALRRHKRAELRLVPRLGTTLALALEPVALLAPLLARRRVVHRRWLPRVSGVSCEEPLQLGDACFELGDAPIPCIQLALPVPLHDHWLPDPGHDGKRGEIMEQSRSLSGSADQT